MAYFIGMLREFVNSVSKTIGAFVLLILLMIPAVLLHSAGYETASLIVGWIAVGVFIISLFSILLEPLVKAFREER